MPAYIGVFETETLFTAIAGENGSKILRVLWKFIEFKSGILIKRFVYTIGCSGFTGHRLSSMCCCYFMSSSTLYRCAVYPFYFVLFAARSFNAVTITEQFKGGKMHHKCRVVPVVKRCGR